MFGWARKSPRQLRLTIGLQKTVAAFLDHLGVKRAEADIADVFRSDIVAFRDSLYGRKARCRYREPLHQNPADAV